LTIAMLADSNDPLIIDQPEDDLDNAFISSTVVMTLRAIKEKRQVIIVTHNANIAVLGDSEFLLPMYRENDCGKAKDRGSIDSAATLLAVQNILEGGPEAFLRRKAGHSLKGVVVCGRHGQRVGGAGLGQSRIQTRLPQGAAGRCRCQWAIQNANHEQHEELLEWVGANSIQNISIRRVGHRDYF
jgi:hypothetical protein